MSLLASLASAHEKELKLKKTIRTLRDLENSTFIFDKKKKKMITLNACLSFFLSIILSMISDKETTRVFAPFFPSPKMEMNFETIIFTFCLKHLLL